MVPFFCRTQPDHPVTETLCLQELKKIKKLQKGSHKFMLVCDIVQRKKVG